MGKNSKVDKDLRESYEEIRKMNESTHKSHKNDLIEFFVGLLMLAGGLFMILQNIQVTSTLYGHTSFWHFGSFNIPNGVIFLPIFIGIMMLFLMDRKIFGWIVIAVGIVIVLLTVLLNTSIHWRSTNAYVFVLMFGITAAGGAMVIRQLLKKD